MKKVFACAVIFCLLLAGCGKPNTVSSNSSSDSSETDSSSVSVDSTIESSTVETQISGESSAVTASSSNTTNSTSKSATTIKQSSTQATTTQGTSATSKYPSYKDQDFEYIRFSDFEKSTQAQLDTMIMDNMKAYVSTDKAHMPSGATGAVKLEYRKIGGWAQMLDMAKGGKSGAGTKLVDPFPTTLGDYEGIRFWLEVTPESGQSFTTLKIIVGDWGYGYRTMYQKEITLPAAGFKDYIKIPFDEMADAYGSPTCADPDNMDFIGFTFSSGSDGCQTNVDIYVSDIQAYRNL